MDRIHILQGIPHEVTEYIIAILTACLHGQRKIDHAVVVAHIHRSPAAQVRRTGGRINGSARC